VVSYLVVRRFALFILRGVGQYILLLLFGDKVYTPSRNMALYYVGDRLLRGGLYTVYKQKNSILITKNLKVFLWLTDFTWCRFSFLFIEFVGLYLYCTTNFLL
jgi:hypothetical protein